MAEALTLLQVIARLEVLEETVKILSAQLSVPSALPDFEYR